MVEVAQQQLAWLVIIYMLGLRPTADAIWTWFSLTQLQLPLHRYQGLSHMMSHLERHPLCLEPPALRAACEDPGWCKVEDGVGRSILHGKIV